MSSSVAFCSTFCQRASAASATSGSWRTPAGPPSSRSSAPLSKRRHHLRRRNRRLSRALCRPDRPSHRPLSHLRRPHDRDRPLSALAIAPTFITAVRHVMTTLEPERLSFRLADRDPDFFRRSAESRSRVPAHRLRRIFVVDDLAFITNDAANHSRYRRRLNVLGSPSACAVPSSAPVARLQRPKGAGPITRGFVQSGFKSVPRRAGRDVGHAGPI